MEDLLAGIQSILIVSTMSIMFAFGFLAGQQR
jgi:hypothetical protein